MQVSALIPARFGSTRFEGKPLVKIAGVPMIERVYRQVLKSQLVNTVMVATDDDRIAEAVDSFGGMVVMTRSDHVSGTDRLAEVAQAHPAADIVVNVQGDEPLIDPRAIDAAVAPLLADPKCEMATLATPLFDPADVENPNVVKVVAGVDGYALYFSRCPLPYYRDQKDESQRQYLGHIGLYVYRRTTLLKLAALPPSPLEKAESLEQLRALENGIRIKVITGNFRSVAVDRPEDVAVVESVLSGSL